jgi:hypothetical protein
MAEPGGRSKMAAFVRSVEVGGFRSSVDLAIEHRATMSANA